MVSSSFKLVTDSFNCFNILSSDLFTNFTDMNIDRAVDDINIGDPIPDQEGFADP
jgi:hypothetical protein